MDRRIFGVETEYGVTCTFGGQRRLSPEEVARYLFRASDFTGNNGQDPASERVLQMWQRVLGAIETGNLDTIAGR